MEQRRECCSSSSTGLSRDCAARTVTSLGPSQLLKLETQDTVMHLKRSG